LQKLSKCCNNGKSINFINRKLQNSEYNNIAKLNRINVTFNINQTRKFKYFRTTVVSSGKIPFKYSHLKRKLNFNFNFKIKAKCQIFKLQHPRNHLSTFTPKIRSKYHRMTSQDQLGLQHIRFRNILTPNRHHQSQLQINNSKDNIILLQINKMFTRNLEKSSPRFKKLHNISRKQLSFKADLK